MPQVAPGGTGLVFVERGGWKRRTRREGEIVVDGATVALELAGESSVVAHLPGVEDRFTRIGLDDAEAEDLRGRSAHLLTGPVLAPIPVMLAHADLVAARRLHLPETDLAGLVGQLVRQVHRSVVTDRADRAEPAMQGRSPLVEVVRARLQVRPGDGLVQLTGLGASRSHLSRSFRRQMGVTFTEYRLRLAVAAAVHALADGAQDLAGLAAESGFADHAHLTRSVRAVTGATPSRLRRRFAFTS